MAQNSARNTGQGTEHGPSGEGGPAGGPLQKKSDADRYITYTKWGLMGVGGVVIVKTLFTAIGAVLTSPIVLIGGVVAGGLAYFGWKNKDRLTSDGSDGAVEQSTTVVGAASVATSAPSAAVARASAEAAAERELDALLAEAPPAASQPSVQPVAPKRAHAPDALDAMEARLQELEALKARMNETDDERG